MNKIYFLLFLSLLLLYSNAFSQEITIITPNGGENWQNSNSYGIVWTDNISGNVKIELFKGGVFDSTIVISTPSDGFYAWVPNVAISGIDYKIKIASVSNDSVYDFSDGYFTIFRSQLNIINPNGGENLQTSSDYGIVWTDNIAA